MEVTLIEGRLLNLVLLLIKHLNHLFVSLDKKGTCDKLSNKRKLNFLKAVVL